MGRSGCGKGTQAKLINEYLTKEYPEFSVFSFETGERLRDFIKNDAYTSTLAREIQEEGGLQPAFLPVWVWSTVFIENLTGSGEHLIIDGTPRKEFEACLFDDALHFYKREKPCYIYLNVSEEWSRKRLTERGRNDDSHTSFVDRKMKLFETDVLPTVEFFRHNSYYHFLDINGEQTIDAVHQEIISHL